MKWTNKGHELDALAEQLMNKKHFYIYGAGENGKFTYDRLKFLPLDTCGGAITFIDASPAKQESGYLGKKVVSLEAAIEANEEERYIIVAVSNLNQPNVIKRLILQGLEEGKDFCTYQEFISVHLPIYAAYKFNKVYHRGIVVVPTRKCALNCKYCLNFIPYAQNPSDDELESVKSDLDRLFASIDCMGTIGLVGGEIFLHPQCNEILQYIGKNFREQIATMYVTTAATVMPDDEVFETLKKYGFVVAVSDYRSALPQISDCYRNFIKKLEAFDVEHDLFEDHEWVDLGVFREKEMFALEKEIIDHFDACGMPWSYYKDGKIWQCSWAGFAIMSDAQEPCEKDCYDLSTCTTEIAGEKGRNHFRFQQDKCKELMEFGMGYSERGYVEMCKKCNGYLTINHCFVPPAIQIPRTQKGWN